MLSDRTRFYQKLLILQRSKTMRFFQLMILWMSRDLNSVRQRIKLELQSSVWKINIGGWKRNKKLQNKFLARALLVFIWSPSSLFQFESVISTEAWQCQQGWEKLREKKETLFGKISKNSIAPQRHRNHLWFHTIDTLCIRKKK